MRDRQGRTSHMVELGHGSGTERDRRSATTHPTGAESFVWEGIIRPNEIKIVQTGDFRDRYILPFGNLLRKDYYDGGGAGLDPVPGPAAPTNISHLLILYTGADAQNSAICRGEPFYTSLGWDGTAAFPTPTQSFQILATKGGNATDLRLYANRATGSLELLNVGPETYAGVLMCMALPQLNALVPIP